MELRFRSAASGSVVEEGLHNQVVEDHRSPAAEEARTTVHSVAAVGL